jgi:glycerophosphoryl diester phosphodiesterase
MGTTHPYLEPVSPGRPLALAHRGGRLMRRAHALGLAVHAWTANDAATMRGLLDAGVDGIMTDHLDVLRDVDTERGIWPT